MLKIKRYCALTTGRCTLNGIPVLNEEETCLKTFLADLYRAMGLESMKFFKMDTLSKAGFLAAELLLREESTEASERETGLFFANSASSLNTDRNYQATIGEKYFPSPSVFVYTLANIVLGEICIRHKLYGENTFFVSSVFPAAHLHRYVEAAFASSAMERALVGWLECDGEHCDVFAMLVEKNGNGTGLDFKEEILNKLYKQV